MIEAALFFKSSLGRGIVFKLEFLIVTNIERSEVIQGGQVAAARQVGGRKQTKQVSGTGKTNRDGPQARHCDLGLTQEGDWRTNAKLKSEIPG